MPRSLTRLFAAALVLTLGACKARPIDNGTTVALDSKESADTLQKSAGAPLPAPPNVPPDTCELGRALAEWGDSARAKGRYGDYVTVRLAHMEVESQPAPGRLPSTTDTTATARACDAARGQQLVPFLESYRKGMPTTVLTADVVRTLGGISAPIAESLSNDTARIGSVAGDTAKQESDTTDQVQSESQTVHRVAVPAPWLAALMASIIGVGIALAYALWRLSRGLNGWMQTLYDTVRTQSSQLAGVKSVGDQTGTSLNSLTTNVENVGKQLDQLRASLTLDFETKQRQTLSELKGQFGWFRSDLTTLRELLAKISGGGSGTGGSSRMNDDDLVEDHAENALGLDPEPNLDWEEATVDVRPTSGGPSLILADPLGVFKVRWANGSDAARLFVDPSSTLSAAHSDRLNAAFRCREAPRGSGRYRTRQDAHCTWDPATRQGRILRQGLVEEVG